MTGPDVDGVCADHHGRTVVVTVIMHRHPPVLGKHLTQHPMITMIFHGRTPLRTQQLA